MILFAVKTIYELMNVYLAYYGIFSYKIVETLMKIFACGADRRRRKIFEISTILMHFQGLFFYFFLTGGGKFP